MVFEEIRGGDSAAPRCLSTMAHAPRTSPPAILCCPQNLCTSHLALSSLQDPTSSSLHWHLTKWYSLKLSAVELHVIICNMHCTGSCSTTLLIYIYILLVELLWLTVDSSAQMLKSIARLLAEAAAAVPS